MVRPVGNTRKIKILFVAANPTNPRLRLDEEIRAIQQKILATEHRDLLDIEQIWAARPEDLLQAFNLHRPHIVHFSAHGSPSGEIILSDHNRQDKPISTVAIQALFATLKDNIRVVLLNACYSKRQARAITSVIDCAIGMNRAVGEEAAIIFAAAFYQALGFGRSVKEAFEQGLVALQLEGIPEHTTPELLCRTGVDPSQIRAIAIARKGHDNHDEYKKHLRGVQDALLTCDYISAYRSIGSIIRDHYNVMLPRDQARLKYLEALVLLGGKRPFSHPFSIIRQIEGLMQGANGLHQAYSYKSILAIFKYDFARAGLRQRILEAEADKLMRDARRCKVDAEDRENISLLSRVQPDLYRGYSHLLNL